MIEGIEALGWPEMIGRLALAGLLGGALGIEREYDGQDAGFRTHLLVVVGAALFAVVSVGGFEGFVARQSDTNVVVDVTRIAAYVAPGIGFIGGGAIIKYGGTVSGITTAASLWTGAAIGVASGLGAWESAVAATVLALVALEVLRPVSGFVAQRGRRRRSDVTIELTSGASVADIVAGIEALAVDPIKRLRFGMGPDDHGEITVDFWQRPRRDVLAELSGKLLELDGVDHVSMPQS